MADLVVAPYRRGHADIKHGFDLGAGPSLHVEDLVQALRDLVEDDVLDEAIVNRVAWMNDCEQIIHGAEPHKHWKRTEAADTITAVCAPKELERILAAMKTLRPHVQEHGLASWDKLTAFLRACAKTNGTVCLWYDPMG